MNPIPNILNLIELELTLPFFFQALTNILRASPFKVSLLDCTLRNVTFLSRPRVFENLTLHGLVISSGEMKRIHKLTLAGLNRNLQALGKKKCYYHI